MTKKTVFNKDNTGYLTKKYPLFLGEQPGLYDSINVAYPELEEFYKLQRSFRWTEDEVNLEQSRMDMLPEKSKSTDIDLMTKTLALLWELDSVASRSVISLFSPFITNSELSALMTEWSAMEVIHALTYSEIIRQCISDPTKAVEEVVKNDEVLGRSENLIAAFDNLALAGAMYNKGEIKDDKELKKTIIKGLSALYSLERVQFMSSFAVIFGMAETNRFIAIASLVQLILRDEQCMTGDHEVLTPNGWVRFDELSDEDQVAQWDYDSKEIEFVNTSKVIRKKYTGKMYQINGGNRNVDQYVTEDHRIPVVSPFTNNPKNKWLYAKDYVPSHTRSIPINGYISNGDSEMTWMEKLLIAFQADGSLIDDPIRNGKVSGCKMFTFAFKKERKIRAFEEILLNLDFRWSKTDRDRYGMISYRVFVPLESLPQGLKNFGWVDYSNVTLEWGREFVKQVLIWDGHTRYNSAYVYINTNREAVDVVQTICHLVGYSTTVVTTKAHQRITGKGEIINAKECYRLSIITRPKHANGQCIKVVEDDVEDLDVYCVRVPSSYFLVRRNGVVSVTGNCHCQFTETIINILRTDEEWEEAFQEVKPELELMLDEVIAKELKWNSYLFSEGRQMVGLNKTLLDDWVLFCAQDLVANLTLKYNHKFISKLPIPWISNWIDINKRQNANQEADNTNYRKNSVVNDLNDDEIFDL